MSKRRAEVLDIVDAKTGKRLKSSWALVNDATGTATLFDGDPTATGEFVWIGARTKRITSLVAEDADGSFDIETFTSRNVEETQPTANASSSSSGGPFSHPRLGDALLLILGTMQSQHGAVAPVCRLFASQARVPFFVARVAAQLTRPARAAEAKAVATAKKARSKAATRKAKTIAFDTGEYKGEARKGAPHGLGVFSATATNESFAGRWFRGSEHLRGEYAYADASSYCGDMAAGVRSGWGISRFTDDYGNACRYEGQWREDLRVGIGLVLGGAYRFCVGRFDEMGTPTGIHMAWNFDSRRVDPLRM